jgi:membrane protein
VLRNRPAPVTVTTVTAASGGRRADRRSTLVSRLDELRARHPWLDHLVPAGRRYTGRHGDHYAAAITYFSLLSLVPLVMIASGAAGYLLSARPELRDQLRAAVTDAVPAEVAGLINMIIDQAVAQRSVVTGVGLVFALYSGIGWVSHLRAAVSEQWAQAPDPPALPKRLLLDLLALFGLGASLAASFIVASLASHFAAEVLRYLGLDDGRWAQVQLQVFGVLLTLTTDFLVFLWVIARLPRAHVALGDAAPAALLGAVGFQLLMQGMSIYLGVVSGSPSAAVFGSTLGLFIFIYYASRFVLFVTAWTATGRASDQERVVPVPAPATIRSELVVRSGPDARTAAGLVGAGIAIGLLGRRRSRRAPDRAGAVAFIPRG